MTGGREAYGEYARDRGCDTSRCASTDCPATREGPWIAGLAVDPEAPPCDIVEVGFKAGRRGHYRIDGSTEVRMGDPVIVEADRGIDIGTVHLTGSLVRLRLRSVGSSEEDEFPLVVRMATATDIAQWAENRERDQETFDVGRRTIERLDLAMKLVDVEWQLDRNKVTFFFTAEKRVDFRELVRRLARRVRTRVELRQIGARDEAARIGGIGSCGRSLCCSTWLQAFRPVSTQAAKTQNLPLNPVRLSGQCGRLKCCLNYELDQYVAALQHFPALDTPIDTRSGRGVVRKVDIFRDRVWVHLNRGEWLELGLAEARSLLDTRGSV